MDYKFKFSIVIAVYNVENYIEETVDSIINQDISFEENVQLILVDDGSTDSSLSIIEKYEKAYPKNIKVISKENGGQASARNCGLKYVEGKYVNFLDSDDYISRNTLREVNAFFEEHYDDIDVVAIPMQLFERVNQAHRLNSKFDKTQVVDLEKNPNMPQLSASSAFIKSEIMKRYPFNENLVNLEDALVINKIFLEKKKYGVLNNVTYFYRQRFDQSSTVDSMKLNKSYYTPRLRNFYINLAEYCIEKTGGIPLYVQYLFAYDIQWLLDMDTLDILDFDERDEFWKVLYQVIDHIDIDCILNNRYINKHILDYFIYLKNHEKMFLAKKDDDLVLYYEDYVYERFSEMVLWLDIVEYKEGSLNFSGSIETSFNTEDINIRAFVKREGKLLEFFTKKVCYNNIRRRVIQHLSVNWMNVYNFDFKYPIEINDEIYFEIEYDDAENKEIISPHISFRQNCGLSTSNAYFIKDSYLVLFKNNRFHIRPYSYKSMLRYEISNVRRMMKDKEPGHRHALYIRFLYFILFPFMKNKRIWLLSDRPNFADDNAKHLFKYSHNICDNTKKYYVVNKDSQSYDDMKKISNNIVAFGSLRHQILYLFSEKVISSYVNENFINPFYFITPALYSGLNTASRYFLQHGVTKDDISEFVKKYDKNLSLIVTVSDLERESFLEDGYNYDENVIQTLGFPRFDNLTSSNKKQILFAPTWRIDLTNKKRLLESQYYQTLNNFFNNEKLKNILEENNYSLVFKPHPELEKYCDLLDIPENVKISKEESYQELFRDSSILITDYSSIFFDFAYLKKAVIYYQKDEDYHYQEGYFKYDLHGFGPVIKNEENLVDEIESNIKSDCIMDEKYAQRVDNFFKYTDKNNSKRVYEWILNCP